MSPGLEETINHSFILFLLLRLQQFTMSAWLVKYMDYVVMKRLDVEMPGLPSVPSMKSYPPFQVSGQTYLIICLIFINMWSRSRISSVNGVRMPAVYSMQSWHHCLNSNSHTVLPSSKLTRQQSSRSSTSSCHYIQSWSLSWIFSLKTYILVATIMPLLICWLETSRWFKSRTEEAQRKLLGLSARKGKELGRWHHQDE